jgi:hypothetical protein
MVKLKESLQLSFLALTVLLAVCALTTTARAQALGAITGTVTDGSGAPIPSAYVTATEAGTGFERSMLTDETGHYTVPNLRPTQYNLTVEAGGFRRFVENGIKLEADQTATLQVRLEVGAASDSITVTASGSAVQVDVATPTLTEVVGTMRIEELPLNGRAVAQLISLAPGASGASPTVYTSQSSLPGSVSPSINGSRTNQTGYLLDGAPFLDQYYNTNIPFPSPDALQEFSVQTSNYSARYGGNAGGMVNVITKSGTNSIHGSLFEFNRNQAYNARNAFTNSLDVSHRNDYGGTFGGPVYFPKIYNGRDRTFFFFAYQGTRLLSSGLNATRVPTTQQLGGDFSGLSKALLDPSDATGRTVFPGNRIPLSRLDPAALTLSTYLPPALDPTGNAYYAKPQRQIIDQISTRIDHNISDRDRIASRIFINTIDLSPQFERHNLPAYALGYHIPVANYMVQETHTFKPNLLNQASFTYSTVPVGKIASADSPNMADFGVKNIWQPEAKFIQSLSVTGYFSVSGGAVGPFNAGSYSFQDDLTWIHGRHDVSLGGVIQRSHEDNGDCFQCPGAFTFTADQTNALGAAAAGDAVAYFLLRCLLTFAHGYGEYKNDRNIFPALYATDTLHATKRLALTMGLRWEPYIPWEEIHGRVEQFSVANYLAGVKSRMFVNAPKGLLFPGDPGVPSRGTSGTMKLFAPRAGFAYALTNDGKTSIRGGAGMFYDAQTPAVINNRFAVQTPFSPTIAVTSPAGPFSNPSLGMKDYPFPFTYPPAKDIVFPKPVQVVTFDRTTNFQVPVIYNWNITVERQIASDWLLQAAYVGSHGSHQKTTVQLNPSVYIPGSTLGTDARRIFTDFGTIGMGGMSANQNYNSLQVALKKRFSYGFTLNIAYTLAKALDTIPNGSSANDIGADSSSPIPWYLPNGRALDYGPNGTDHKHRFVASYVWMLPKLTHSHPLMRGLVGGWELSGIMTLQSGDALTLLAGTDVSLTALGQDRVDVVAGQNPYQATSCGATPGCAGWLNKNAFARPATGTFGNAGKGALRGPGSFGFDAGMSKNFAVTERLKLQFRGEFFNALNHVNLGNPNTTFSSADFGRIRSVDSPRVGQLVLKLSF